MQNVSVVWQWLQPYRARFALAMVLVVLQAAIAVATPLLFGKGIVDHVLLDMQDASLLAWVAAGVIVLIFVKGIVTYTQTYTMNYIGLRLVATLRGNAYEHMLTLPLDYYGRRRSGEVISKMTNDMAVIQQAVTMSVADVIRYVLTLVGILAALLWLHWQMALVSFVVLPLATLAINTFGGRIRAFSKRFHEKVADMAALVGETVGGMRIIKAFTMERFVRDRFREANEQSFTASMKSVQAQATLKPIVELILVTGMVLVLWVGGTEVIAGRLTVGELMSFLALLGMLSQPVDALTHQYGLLQQAAAAGRRIEELLQARPEPQHVDVWAAGGQLNGASGAAPFITLPRVDGHIQFENVTFGYDGDTPVLKDINLTIEPGQVVALVGPSGAGKSTLVNLMARFYDAQHGAVRVDGYDLRGVAPASLRRQIGLVPQDPVLFSMSVRDNIRVGLGVEGNAADVDGEKVDEAVRRAATLAHAHEFIVDLPAGYDTPAGERGANLSGGQRQRLAIARAIVGDPRILILDEATSALDTESEVAIHAAIDRIRAGRTVILIAHRASTVRLADRIVVLDGGRIVQDGTHETLVREPGTYRRLYSDLLADGVAKEAG